MSRVRLPEISTSAQQPLQLLVKMDIRSLEELEGSMTAE